MELVLIIQITFVFVIFCLTFFCMLLPMKIVSPDRRGAANDQSQRIISFCNCFSGGVFLGTCFLQLIPFIQVKFEQIFRHLPASWMEFASPVTQLSVMLGFFLILVTEQLVRMCQERRVGTAGAQRPSSQQHLVNISTEHSSDDEDDLDGETDDSEKGLLGEAQTILTKKPNTLGEVNVHAEAVETASADHRGPFKPTKDRTTKRPKKRVCIGRPNNTQYDDEQFTGHSHGHSHGHGHSHLADIVKDDFGLRCLLLLVALSLHSLFEGMAQGLQDELYKAVTLFIGIAVHEVLVAFAIGVSLAQQRLRLATVIKMCFIFSLTIPLGMALGMGLNGLHSLAGQVVSAVIQGLTAGTFVYVTFLEILPAEINSKKHRMLKVVFIFFGFAVIACLRFAMRMDDVSAIQTTSG